LKEFKLSDYPNRLEFQHDKDNYLDKLIKALSGRLIELGEVFLDTDNRLCWCSNCELVVDDDK
jgi:hypothetical protein